MKVRATVALESQNRMDITPSCLLRAVAVSLISAASNQLSAMTAWPCSAAMRCLREAQIHFLPFN